MTLREVSERMLEQGERFPTSTLVRIEQGKLDPGVRRLYLLMRLYKIPPHLVADLVELEEQTVAEPPEEDLKTLYDRGIELWQKGEPLQALAYLFKIRQIVPENEKSRLLRQKAILSFAVFARDLGKLRLAQRLVEDLLCDSPDPSLVPRALVIGATVSNDLGSIELALALVQRAAGHVGPRDHQQRAWVLHEEARLLVKAGELERASQMLDKALRLYRKLRDYHGETKAMIVRVPLLEKQGDLDAALAAARKVIRKARQHGHDLSEMSGRLELGRLLVLKGAVEKGLEELRASLSKAVLAGSRYAEFHAHYQLWKAYESIGDKDRMRFELQSASYFVKFIDHSCPEANEVRRILDEKESRGRGRRRRGPSK